MMYETYLRQLFRLRTEYWQTQNTVVRNLKLSRMVLFANACGVDKSVAQAAFARATKRVSAEEEGWG